MATSDSITFLPHLMREFPAELALEGGHLTASIDFQVYAQDQKRVTETRKLVIRGPGDILGIHPRMIARVEPPSGSTDFEPNYFPFIEFVDADFLWRYSLEVNASAARVHPWLSLLVLSAPEIEQMSQEAQIDVITRLRDDRELLSIRGDLLPSLENAWASAHVQLSGLSPEEAVPEFLARHPANHSCRLFCCRRLLPETRYSAYLVPNYQSAVDAALGITDAQPSDVKAWGSPTRSDVIRLPIYYHWSFQTSVKGDFEELAGRLRPVVIGTRRIGTRAVDASRMSNGSPESIPFFLREGAVVPPDFEAERLPYSKGSAELPLTEALKKSLNESLASESEDGEAATDAPDPLITFPVYGRHYRKTQRIESPTNDHWAGKAPWVHELNLDFRYRVAAGLGTRAIRQHQDEYMRECWEQVGEIRAANERVRLTKAASILGKALEKKHLAPLPDERHLLTTVSFHAHIATTDRASALTFKKTFAESGIVQGVLSQTFKRIAHRRIAIHRTKPCEPWKKAMSPPTYLRALGMRTAGATHLLANEVGIALPEVEPQVAAPKPEVVPVSPVDLSDDFRPRVDLAGALRSKLHSIVRLNDGTEIAEEFDPIMRAPRVDQPMYKPLEQLSADYVLPGLEFLENDGVTLFEENRRLIEAYMAGLNHEMNQELVWQRFPTDMRGTIFRYFWDPTTVGDRKDIKDIHQWANALGQNEAVAGAAGLVLVLKGELIRRYPGTIIYAVHLPQYYSDLYPNGEQMAEDVIIDPVFRAYVLSDILMVGFPFSRDQVAGPTRSGEYYFVLQENQDLPRFGLDVQSTRVRRPELVPTSVATLATAPASAEVPAQPSSPSSEDLTWADIPEAHMRAGYINHFDDSLFGDNSASVASRTYQRPIRVVIHSSHMLPAGEAPWHPRLSAGSRASSLTPRATRR